MSADGTVRARQGEMWLVRLSPTEGHEQSGTRPALVVSRNALNNTGRCMVVPGTRTYRRLPGRVTIPQGEGGLPEETYLLCDQLRTIDSARLVRRYGTVEKRYVAQVLTQVRYFLTEE